MACKTCKRALLPEHEDKDGNCCFCAPDNFEYTFGPGLRVKVETTKAGDEFSGELVSRKSKKKGKAK